ncbi:hypothetical protein SDC9_139986 [bioreactor metagenome]|jgi:hypothetical protein|uniref:Uncharacterized protein n=1 Tax=bioreactor metagenome TaxID=1076179 RepID=A0A645DTN4_9ZZZZ
MENRFPSGFVVVNKNALQKKDSVQVVTKITFLPEFARIRQKNLDLAIG